jgi:hypothetical protein
MQHVLQYWALFNSSRSAGAFCYEAVACDLAAASARAGRGIFMIVGLAVSYLPFGDRSAAARALPKRMCLSLFWATDMLFTCCQP